MSFDPIPGQFYRIVAKHSGQILEIEGDVPHRGAPIQQGVWVEKAYQQFQFHREGDFFNIVSRSSGRSFDLPDSRGDEGMGIIQWDRHDYSTNQQWAILPAGGGYYYISARPTEKFVCVQDGKSGIGVRLVQQSWSGGDHFLFSFEPCTPMASPRALRTAVLRGADPIREAVIALTGLIPTAGGGVKFLLGLLWQDSGGTLIEQIREYVRDVAKEMIDNQALIDLANKLEGLKDAIDLYSTDPTGSKMDAVLMVLTENRPHFFNTQFPEKTLPYLLTLGSMHLAALREHHDTYEKLYGHKPEKPGEVLKFLKDTVDKYVKGAAAARKATAEWRQKYITLSQRMAYKDGHAHHDYFYVEDKYDGWSFVADEGQIDQSRRLGNAIYEERKRVVKEEFDAELDALFGPALMWKYMKPDLAEKPAVVRVATSSPFFGTRRGTGYAQVTEPDNPVNEIHVWGNGNDRIHAIAIGRKNGGGLWTVGETGGNESLIKCGAGEYFTGVYGTHGGGDGIYSIYFVTNKGRILGVGRRVIGAPFAGEPPVGSDARLEGIQVCFEGNRLFGIGFQWGYARKE
jgi:hypothetical protein